jgi:hypothetical protein
MSERFLSARERQAMRQAEAQAMRPIPGSVGALVGAGLGQLAPQPFPRFGGLGAPFVTASALGYEAEAWRLSDGKIVARIGRQSLLLDDWEAQAHEIAPRYGWQSGPLLAFCAFVRSCADAQKAIMNTPSQVAAVVTSVDLRAGTITFGTPDTGPQPDEF